MSDEEYERVKQEIGWHTTAWDVAFFVFMLAFIGLLAWLS